MSAAEADNLIHALLSIHKAISIQNNKQNGGIKPSLPLVHPNLFWGYWHYRVRLSSSPTPPSYSAEILIPATGAETQEQRANPRPFLEISTAPQVVITGELTSHPPLHSLTIRKGPISYSVQSQPCLANTAQTLCRGRD